MRVLIVDCLVRVKGCVERDLPRETEGRAIARTDLMEEAGAIETTMLKT